MHYNVSALSEYNIYQYIHMPDKGWRLSDLGSAFLHLNAGNGAMPINLRPKFPPYVVFLRCINFVLYACCIKVLYACFIFRRVWICIFSFFFPIFLNWKQTGLVWCEDLPDICVLYQYVVWTCPMHVAFFMLCFFKGAKSYDHWWKKTWITMVTVRLGLGLGLGLGLFIVLFFCVVLYVLYFPYCI